MPPMKAQIKAMLTKGLLDHDSNNAAKYIRESAKLAFRTGDKVFAIQLIELAMNFLEQSNQFMLAMIDWHYYKTGERLTPEQVNFEGPELSAELPWEQLKSIIESL